MISQSENEGIVHEKLIFHMYYVMWVSDGNFNIGIYIVNDKQGINFPYLVLCLSVGGGYQVSITLSIPLRSQSAA